MFWQEDSAAPEQRVSDDVVDVLFALKGRQIPVDHAHVLSRAVQGALPWLAGEPRAGVHPIHVAGSQNGWQRPDDLIHLSRRTKLTLRLPRERLADAQALVGVILDLAGHPVEVGPLGMRALSTQGTLFTRYLVCEPGEPEEAFLIRVAGDLARMGIRVRKALCGRTSVLDRPQSPVHARSLMLADLSVEESVKLQQEGLGPLRIMGCGIFIPHKGIEAIKKSQERD